MEPLLSDTILEVNIDNLAFNLRNIRNMFGEKVAIAAVVKANAYGHRAIGIAKELMKME